MLLLLLQNRGHCEYGVKCQFAHGPNELRSASRHRRYKTEACRTYNSTGFCPYGPRCNFIHDEPMATNEADEYVQDTYTSNEPQSDNPTLADLWPPISNFSSELYNQFQLTDARGKQIQYFQCLKEFRECLRI
jgi:butyrate response factor 1